MFGYVDALAHAGVDTVLVLVSRELDRVVGWRRGGDGALILGLPEPALHRSLRRMLVEPYASSAGNAVPGRGRLGRLRAVVPWNVSGYAATPPILLARALRRLGAAAILCQEYEYPRFDVATALGAALRVPVFATYQGGDAHYATLEKLVRPRAIRRSAGLVIASHRETERVRGAYAVAPRRIAEIPNPLDTSWWSPGPGSDVRRRLGVGPDDPLVAWHGRLAMRRKGLDVLLEAWSIVERRSRRDRATLVMIGDGPDAAAVTTLIEDLGLENVRLLRRYVLDPSFIRDHLRAADVYVLPSRHEGFAVAPLEAMACGLPVVAADASGVEDLLPDGDVSGGVVVPVGDPRALAAGLNALLDRPDRIATLGAAARRRAEAFALPAIGQRLRTFMEGCGATFGPPAAPTAEARRGPGRPAS